MGAAEHETACESLLPHKPADLRRVQISKAPDMGEVRAPRGCAKIGEEARALNPVHLGDVVPATVGPSDPAASPASGKFAYFNQVAAPASLKVRMPNRAGLVQPRLVDGGYR
jgi:hypothetical protein